MTHLSSKFNSHYLNLIFFLFTIIYDILITILTSLDRNTFSYSTDSPLCLHTPPHIQV